MTAAFVLDASMTLAWHFPSEGSQATRDLLLRMERATVLVPLLWFSEVANGLVMGVRRSRTTNAAADEFIALLNTFELEVDDHSEHHAFTQALSYARQHVLSVYDAVYLDLAIRSGLPLATMDGPLAKAAVRHNVSILGT